MTKKRNLSILMIVCLFLVAGLYYFSVYKQGEEEKISETDEAQRTTQHEQKKVDKKRQQVPKETEKKIMGRADIPFRKYEQIYKHQHVIELREFDQAKTCSKIGDNFGYSFIDFVFLEKTKKGNLRPFKIRRLDYSKANALPNRGAALGTGEAPSSKVRFAVVKDCHVETSALKPGKKYKFTRFKVGKGDYEEVNYKFKVPGKEKFDFVPPDSKQEPKAYRFPILVNDIRKTIQSPLPERKKITLTIKNAYTSIPDSKVGEIWDIIVTYDDGEFTAKKEGISEGGVYGLEASGPKGIQLSEGIVKIYGPFHWDHQTDQSYGSTQGFQLLMYKHGINSAEIDMSEGLAYNHRPEKTVMKEVNIQSYIENHDDLELSTYHEKPIPSRRPNVALKKSFNGKDENKYVKIFAAAAYKKNGEWVIKIEALPGEYVLAIDRRIIDKNYNWPQVK